MLVRCVAIALKWLSLLVPQADGRERWRARWPHSLPAYASWLDSRQLPANEVRRQLLRYLNDAGVEAASARWPLPEVRELWLRRLRKPWVALILPLTMLATGLWWSNGASFWRASRRPLSTAWGERLVTAVPERSFFGKAHGFTPRQFKIIGERARSFAALDGYAIRLETVESRGEPSRVRRLALAGPGVFAALGFAGNQAYVAEQLGASRWLGRTIVTGGHSYRIGGVWPGDLRPALTRPDFWLPERPAERFDTTMVAVLAPGVSYETASREIRDILLSAPARRGSGTPTAVIPLRHGQAGMLGALWAGFLVTLAGLVGFAAWRATRQGLWRLELFFLAKALPLMAGIFCWSVAGFARPASGSASGPFLIFWLTGIAAVMGIWWARRDQRLRCPECLTRMTLAVQIGTHGAALLEGVGDEVLCEYGHGALWLPGAPAQAFGPEVWRSE